MDVLEYVLSREGIAQCFLKDLENMRVSYDNLETIFWLNEIPCRAVLVVALVVGVQDWEKKKTYILLDDGSAVAECALKHVAPPKPEPEPEPKTPKKAAKKSGKKSKVKAKPDSNIAAAGVNAVASASTTAKPNANSGPNDDDRPLILVPPCPLPVVGTVVKVIGKITIGREQSKTIRIDSMVEVDHMEEVLHWKKVMELHKSKYSKPFAIPVSKSSDKDASITRSLPPIVIRTLDAPTPRGKGRERGEKRKRVTPDSLSPARSSSPIKSPHQDITPKARPEKDAIHHDIAQESLSSVPDTGRLASLSLRHPSQLSHRELNLNTFRVYLNFIMLRLLEQDFGSGSEDKGKGTQPQVSISYSNGAGFVADDTSQQHLGMGISYLMRVPELNLLAERIEREERRQTEDRRVLREKENTSNHRNHTQDNRDQSSKTSKTKASEDSTRKRNKFKKRLFSEAIRTLFQDGAIIIHNGRSRKWNEDQAQILQEVCKWKWRKGHAPKAGDVSTSFNNVRSESFAEQTTFNTTFNATFNTTVNTTTEEEESDEETYIPVTNEVLTTPILLAIRQVSSRKKKAGGQIGSDRGVSMEEILEDLHSTDGRWERVRDIKSALSYLEGEDMIWELAPSLWAIM